MSDSYGLDLHDEVKRLRGQNSTLVKSIFWTSVAGVVALIIGLSAYFKKPEPDRVAVGPNMSVVQMQPLTSGDPPDARVTRFVSDCITDLLNQPFNNFQRTVERAIGDCFTGGGSASIRETIYPLLDTAKDKKMNITATWSIQPFINSRRIEGNLKTGYRVFNIQAVLSVGYRGQTNSSKPVDYALEVNVARVPFDSNVEGLRLQNLVLKIR